MKLVVEEPFLREPFRRRHPDQAAAYARPAKAHVVEQHQKDVGRTFGGPSHRREILRGIGRVHPDGRVRKPPLGLRQMTAIQMDGKFRRLRVGHGGYLSNSGERPAYGSWPRATI